MMHLHTIHIFAIIIISILSISTLSACTFTVPLEASSGSPVVEWTATYGAQAVVQTEDGGYLFAGSELGLLVKADSLGHVEWNRTYAGVTGSLLAIFKTADEGYMATGATENKTWLLKVDASGNVLWNKTHEIDATCVVQTGDEGYIFVGNILLKVNASGDLQWSKPIGGTWVTESEDGYIIGYQVHTEMGAYDLIVQLIGTDAEGITEWNKTCVLLKYDPTPPLHPTGFLSHVIGTNDGGILLTWIYYGGMHGADAYLQIYKFDSSGNVEWTISGGARSSAGGMVQTFDGGYVITGLNRDIYHQPTNAFLFKINQTGAGQWEADFESEKCCGGTVIEMFDGGFLVTTNKHLYKFSPYPRHNIAISKVAVPSGRVKEGDFALIDVTIENNGDFDQITRVFLYNDSSSIDSQNVTVLTGTSETVTFSWNTTGVKIGQHTILANATRATDETYMQDNIGQAVIVIAAGSKISISTVTSTVLIGLQISISGTLTDHREKAISGELVFLSYQVFGVESWNIITSVSSETNGHYSAVWIPTATGYFTLKAEWTGNATYFGVSNVTTLSVVPYNNKYVFAVESNSTISVLAFNSTANELSFIASGPPGTMGYARVFISKELVANISDLKVYVDENQVNYVTTSTDSSWILCFSYEHSTHDIVIAIPEFPSVLFLPLLLVSTLGAVVLSKKRRQKKRDLREKSPFDFLEHLAKCSFECLFSSSAINRDSYFVSDFPVVNLT